LLSEKTNEISEATDSRHVKYKETVVI
jgi:hypothetical protein